MISLPATAESGLPQDFSGLPSTSTMQQPHCSRPQPNLVPIRPRWLRRISRSEVSGPARALTLFPLTIRRTVFIDFSLAQFVAYCTELGSFASFYFCEEF